MVENKLYYRSHIKLALNVRKGNSSIIKKEHFHVNAYKIRNYKRSSLACTPRNLLIKSLDAPT